MLDDPQFILWHGKRTFSFLQNVLTNSAVLAASYSMGTEGSFLVVKWLWLVLRLRNRAICQLLCVPSWPYKSPRLNILSYMKLSQSKFWKTTSIYIQRHPVYLHANMLRYRFFCLLSGCWECSDEYSSCVEAACIASYSLLKPMSPSAWSSVTCFWNKWTGMAVFRTPPFSALASQSTSVGGGPLGGSSR